MSTIESLQKMKLAPSIIEIETKLAEQERIISFAIEQKKDFKFKENNSTSIVVTCLHSNEKMYIDLS